jgi:hypothetical protein
VLNAVADSGDTCNSIGGTCAPLTQITAQFTGTIDGNLFYFSANFHDYVRVIDTNPNNSWTSPWLLENQLGTTQPNVTFGSAIQGDVLRIELCTAELQTNQMCDANSDYLFSNDPSHSHDGLNHAQSNTLGPGYIDPIDHKNYWAAWMEDLDSAHDGDFDYNDEVVTLHNVIYTFTSRKMLPCRSRRRCLCWERRSPEACFADSANHSCAVYS